RNRTTGEIRHMFGKHNGSLGETGCVGGMFERRGQIYAAGAGKSEDDMMEIALESGADDIEADDAGGFLITTDPNAMQDVREAVEVKGVTIESAEVNMVPKTAVEVEGKEAEQVVKLLNALEDHD